MIDPTWETIVDIGGLRLAAKAVTVASFTPYVQGPFFTAINTPNP